LHDVPQTAVEEDFEKMAENIEEKVKKLVAEQFEVPLDKVTLNSLFMDDLKADSLSVVELVLAIEEAFGLEIPDEDAEKIKTVGDVVNYVKTRAK
jgi:acyl carrier protein